ncbi:MAG: SPW repeat protein [Acetobacteraceae bacterium]|nr:SPW repeat protein [Acetobacteraceae bacterium]
MRMGWIPMVLGLWLIAAPFVLGYSRLTTALWNDVIVGIVVAATSWLALMERRRERTRSS